MRQFRFLSGSSPRVSVSREGIFQLQKDTRAWEETDRTHVQSKREWYKGKRPRRSCTSVIGQKPREEASQNEIRTAHTFRRKANAKYTGTPAKITRLPRAEFFRLL